MKVTVSAIVWLSVGSVLQVQAQTPTPRFTMQGAAEPSLATVPRDPLGRPCLDVEAAARPEVVNPLMIDHVVSMRNKCPTSIKAKVCYYNSDHCNQVEIMAYKRVDTILGSAKGITFFRYTINQK